MSRYVPGSGQGPSPGQSSGGDGEPGFDESPTKVLRPGRILAAVAVSWVTVVVAVVGGTVAAGAKYSRDSAAEALETREVELRLGVFEIIPDVIEIQPQTELTFVVENTDDIQHDITISPQISTGRLKPGETASLRAGIITRDFVIWCSIKGHREQGMEAAILVKG